MGVDTKVLLTSAPDILDVLKFASNQYGNATLSPFPNEINAYWLQFKDGDSERVVSVFAPNECASDYADVTKGPAVYMSMGCWGNSEAIARRFAVKFGGMIMPNDCKDDWMNP